MASESWSAFDTARRAGLLDPTLAFASATAYVTWGASPAAAFAASACRFPRRRAVVDDEGSLTFAQLDRRTDAMAVGLVDMAPAGTTIGLLARNSRGFVEAYLAAAKAGATVVLLNIGFAAPQLADVIDREGVSLLLHDDEFTPLVALAAPDLPAVAIDNLTDPTSLATLAERHAGQRPGRPATVGQPVLLTSGTTGVPKGARRERAPRDPRAFAGLLSAVPYEVGDVVVVPAPLFHAWGFSHFILSGALGMTLVLQRHFEPEETLALVERHRANALAVVPVMLQRIMALGPEVIARYQHPRLRIVASSGSALPGRLANEWMAAFGDNLYNLYGSTEVGQATIAGPADLHAAPGTAGLPMAGARVAVMDPAGHPLPAGRVGRIFVGNGNHFDGYTGGGSKERIGDLMATGDLGYLDRQGRLYVGGRSDDMIVSGGENVFPREVEDLLITHRDILDAVVVGVDDEEYGQRLAVWVVLRRGASLSADDVRQLVHNRLARHKVPRDVMFVGEIPRNATGKVMRRHVQQATREERSA
jgi:acyl-CoA synthetase (AMP-forming)/AMP-acid ligase II